MHADVTVQSPYRASRLTPVALEGLLMETSVKQIGKLSVNAHKRLLQLE